MLISLVLRGTKIELGVRKEMLIGVQKKFNPKMLQSFTDFFANFNQKMLESSTEKYCKTLTYNCCQGAEDELAGWAAPSAL